MLFTALGFLKSKRVTEQYSTSEPKAVGFSQGFLTPWAQRKYYAKNMAQLVSLVYNLYMVQREILFSEIENL